MKITARELRDTVLKEGICSGCGVCTVSKKSPFEMEMSKQGSYVPKLKSNPNLEEQVVCPFSNNNFNEDKIAKEVLSSNEGQNKLTYSSRLGYYDKLYAGHVFEGEYRKLGSSGGSVSWLCNKLLELKLVDAVIHVKESVVPNISFEYSISYTQDEVNKGSKSRYYPIKMDEVLKIVQKTDKKFLIVGVPCFIKAVNLLKIDNDIFSSKIPFTVSIVCGHLKTSHYQDMLIAQIDKSQNTISKFNFRHKLANRLASDYGTSLVSNNKLKIKLNKMLFGTNWGLNLFKLKACDYCDDVVGETADISFGDAWLPKYNNDYKGSNVIIVRNQLISKIIDDNIASGKLKYDILSEEEVYQSQAGGFRHRREGLSYRLFKDIKDKKWVPVKRVSPMKPKDPERALIYENRVNLREVSFYSSHYKNIKKLKKELKNYLSINDQLNGNSKLRLFVKNFINLFDKP